MVQQPRGRPSSAVQKCYFEFSAGIRRWAQWNFTRLFFVECKYVENLRIIFHSPKKAHDIPEISAFSGSIRALLNARCARCFFVTQRICTNCWTHAKKFATIRAATGKTSNFHKKCQQIRLFQKQTSQTTPRRVWSAGGKNLFEFEQLLLPMNCFTPQVVS